MLPNNKAQEEVEKFMHGLTRRNPGETEFHQAVSEVAESLMPFILEHKEYQDNAILERLTEPDRIIIFRVCWQDEHGHVTSASAGARLATFSASISGLPTSSRAPSPERG